MAITVVQELVPMDYFTLAQLVQKVLEAELAFEVTVAGTAAELP